MLRTLGVSFLFLSFLDLITTLLLINLCGYNIEGNPVASWLYVTFGLAGMAGLKLVTIVVVITIVRYIRYKRGVFYPYLILITGCLIYLCTVGYTLSLTNVFIASFGI